MDMFFLVEKIRITIKRFAKLPCGPFSHKFNCDNIFVIGIYSVWGRLVLWCMTFENH